MRLDSYLQRIGISGPLSADLATLRALHLAHRETFRFDNLEIQTGGTIRLDLETLERKFLDEGRGGYCFEHNSLFDAVLRDTGFTTIRLLGRVRRGPPELWVRTHLLLLVEVLGGHWLADVGFGAFGLLEPFELEDGATAVQGGIRYSLRQEEGLWILAMGEGHSKEDLYEFTLDAQTVSDIEMSNHYTATHPQSIFRRALTIQRASREERIILRGNLLIRFRDGARTETAVARDRLAEVASQLFDVTLPDGPLLFDSAIT